MINEISGWSAPKVYEEALFKVPLWVKEQNSRNGPVLRVPDPVMLTLLDPQRRVLFDSIRKANPYFHVMEFIWMMAGDNSTRWISQFNKGFKNYAENDGLHHGAYGHRWREHFGGDQIITAAEELRRDPESRRVVLAMWDPYADQGRSKKDLPCNTHIYVDIQEGRLNFTVCNRSNDLFWGMLGSNVVHMTLLQELMACALKVPLGVYRVFTNNLHVYPNMPRFQELWTARFSPDLYTEEWGHHPVLAEGEKIEVFLNECWGFIHAPKVKYESSWLENVATPMYNEYMRRLGLKSFMDRKDIKDIQAPDWRKACELWEIWHA